MEQDASRDAQRMVTPTWLVEAAADVFDFGAFADAVEAGHPAALAGVPEYLTHVDYRGPVASPYFDDRRRDILAPFTDEARQRGLSLATHDSMARPVERCQARHHTCFRPLSEVEEQLLKRQEDAERVYGLA